MTVGAMARTSTAPRRPSDPPPGFTLDRFFTVSARGSTLARELRGGPLTIVLMPFTYSITAGIGAGFVTYVLIKLGRGHSRVIHPLLWLIAALSSSTSPSTPCRRCCTSAEARGAAFVGGRMRRG